MEMVDESGMLSNPLFLSLLRATPTVPLLLFGDPDQLPPIERGEPFRSMIDCGRIPVFTLHGGRRFNAESREAIITTAEACLAQNSGEFLSLLQEPEIRPFVTLVTPSTPDDEGIVETIVRGIRAGINAGKNLDDFQIVSKLNHLQQRTISTRVLHQAVADAFVANDPTRRSLRLSNGMVIREGERVMQSKNNDDINLMNGDIGTIEHIAGRRVELRVADTGAVIPLTPFQCQTLIGGFAGTPHKLQGGGFHTVVIPLSFDNQALLGYRALFTSMTRATNRIILVGTPHTAEQAVLYEDYPARITTFETTLKRDLPTIRPPVMQPELIIA
jgi:exodeoxyribonuclease V alpha subunit